MGYDDSVKAYLFLFLVTPVFANVFSYEDRPYNFHLSIDKNLVSFSSESFRYAIPVSDCNLPLARDLNAELIALAQSEKNGAYQLMVDKQKVSVGRKSKLRKYLRNLSIRMRQFGIEEKKKCDK